MDAVDGAWKCRIRPRTGRGHYVDPERGLLQKKGGQMEKASVGFLLSVGFAGIAALTWRSPNTGLQDHRTPGGESPVCDIQLHELAVVKGEAVDKGIVRVSGDRIFLRPNYSGHEIFAFDWEGNPVHSYGKQGQGPGEFENIRDFQPLPDGGLAVFEATRLTVLDADGEVRSTHSLIPGSYLTDFGGTVRLEDGSYLITGRAATQEAFGHPFARVDSEGSVIQYFGRNETESDGPLQGYMVPRILAAGPDGAIVSVKRFYHVIEIWKPSGDLIERYSREVDWMHWPPDFDPARHRMGPPEDQFVGAQYDADGRLWLMAQVTPDEWREGIRDGRVVDAERWTDFQIEVLRLTSGPDSRTLCTKHLKPVFLGFGGPGIAVSYDEDWRNRPLLRLWRLDIVPAGERGSPSHKEW